jgi:metal-dependent amidase/aminoacylase/carboxypeptidase family protein
MSDSSSRMLAELPDLLPELEAAYEDIHAHPELSMQETRTASEDFGCFGTEWHAPSVYWFVGGTDPAAYAEAKANGRINDLPVNHSPKFAPVLHPTLATGVEAMTVAALAWNAT